MPRPPRHDCGDRACRGRLARRANLVSLLNCSRARERPCKSYIGRPVRAPRDMRILFLALDIDLSKQRGDTIHAVELASAFHELGHVVMMVVGAGSSHAPRTTPQFPVKALSGSNTKVLAGIRELIRAFTPEIVYERRSTPKIGFAVRLGWGVPVVMEINGILGEELSSQGRHIRDRDPTGARRLVRKAMFKSIDRFVAVSDAISNDLVESCGVKRNRVFVIGNGVNADRFRPIDKGEASSSLGLSADRPRIVFVGNLVGWRDFDTVLEALAISQRRIPGLEFIIVGDGPERARLEKAARSLPPSTVRFMGEVPYSQVPEWICASDVCLLPERRRDVDISPLKLFEYMACERPVIGFDVEGLELLESLGAGVLVPSDRPGALSEVLENLIMNPALRCEMGKRGRAYVEKDRTWRKVASSIVRVMQGAMGVEP